MKKPVLIIISIIYIIAIAVVGFLGISARIFNPQIFVEDIQLTFDPKLEDRSNKINDVEREQYNLDYKYLIKTSETVVSFYVSAAVLPNNATNKKCAFTAQNTAEYYTMEVSDLKGDYTTATFTVDTTKYAEKTKTIYFSVESTDGNKDVVKHVMIFIQKG